MKKAVLLLILCLCISFFATGCSDAKEEKTVGTELDAGNTNTGSDTLLSEQVTVTDNTDSETAKNNTEDTTSSDGTDGTIDVDLTEQSSTMVYAEVYNMMVNPDDYMGKMVKIRGQYNSEYWDQTDKYYFYVIISDATACCQQGIEFIWDDGEHKYPDDYPHNNTTVEITGVFGSYEELGDIYYYLDTDDIMIVK